MHMGRWDPGKRVKVESGNLERKNGNMMYAPSGTKRQSVPAATRICEVEMLRSIFRSLLSRLAVGSLWPLSYSTFLPSCSSFIALSREIPAALFTYVPLIILEDYGNIVSTWRNFLWLTTFLSGLDWFYCYEWNIISCPASDRNEEWTDS